MLRETPYNAATAVGANTSSTKIRYCDHFTYQIIPTDLTPGAKIVAAGSVSTVNDTFTSTAHGYITGLAVQLTTSGGLPTGLATSTTYYLIKVDADTFKFATSAANAAAGTQIDLTTAGTGNHTVTPTAFSMSLKLQESTDDTNWVDISGATATLSASASSAINVSSAGYMLVRGVLAVTAGYATIKVIVTGKERAEV